MTDRLQTDLFDVVEFRSNAFQLLRVLVSQVLQLSLVIFYLIFQRLLQLDNLLLAFVLHFLLCRCLVHAVFKLALQCLQLLSFQTT